MPPRTETSSVTGGQLLARFESVPFNSWHLKARMIMGSATFFDAFGALSLAFALPMLNRLWHLTLPQSGVLISATYVGQFGGAILFSWLAERFGRVRSASIAVAIIALMSVGCALAQNLSALIVCRVAQGIGIGGEMPVAAAYISEISPARWRGRFFLLYEMIFPIGLMAAGQAGAWLVPLWGWRSIFLLGGIPCIIISVLLMRLPESPRWLIARDRLQEAEQIIRQAGSRAEVRGLIPAEPPPIAVPENIGNTRWREVVSGDYRMRTVIVWMLWICAYFVSNTLNNWLPTLYSSIYHLNLKTSLRAASLTNIAQVLVLLVCASVIDRLGRRNWTIACFFAGAVLLGGFGISGVHGVEFLIAVATLSYGIVESANAVLYMYTPEI